MGKHATAYSRFIEDPSHPSTALQWFRRQALVPEETAFDWGIALVFPSIGSLQYAPDGSIDAAHSPVVTVHLPKVRRQILWTVGEVHFRPSPFSQFPKLAALRRSFLRWFESYPLIYEHHPAGKHQFDYYLEGSAMNWGPIRAFPSGMVALESERYFVSCRESDHALSTLCKKLRLRGVNCSAAD
jgi:hypothetical protein